MNKSKRLSVLIKIEKSKEREEVRKWSEFVKVVEDNKKKLMDLEGYLQEYRVKFADLTRQGAVAAKIRDSYAFINQLNTVISQQQQAVRELESTADEYRNNWILAKQRVEILEKTINKFRNDELRHEQKVEQLLADELARHKQRTD